MILDTSAIYEVLTGGPNTQFVVDKIYGCEEEILLSIVTYTETLCVIRNRHKDFDAESLLSGFLNECCARVVPLESLEAANECSLARQQYKSLNFGDIFVYNLAKRSGFPLVTLDADFIKTDIEVLHPD